MPRRNSENHSRKPGERLEEAMALLIQNQAQFLSNQSQLLALHNAMEARTDERFARIENILARHEKLFHGLAESIGQLPEAIRQKIGFKSR